MALQVAPRLLFHKDGAITVIEIPLPGEYNNSVFLDVDFKTVLKNLPKLSANVSVSNFAPVEAGEKLISSTAASVGEGKADPWRIGGANMR